MVISSQAHAVLLKVGKRMILTANCPQKGHAKINRKCFVKQSLRASFFFSDDPVKELSLSHPTHLLRTLNPVVSLAHFIYLLLVYFYSGNCKSLV